MVRSDARENRERILVVAREVFAEPGEASLNQIAQRAGVGAGTLYRHFPTREDLVLAVYQDEVERLVGAAPELLAANAPIDGLRLWTTDLVAAMRQKHGLGEALGQSAHQAAADRSYGPVMAVITAFFEAGKADGSIRVDAHPADFLMLTGALWRAIGHADADSGRMLELILDGLRTR
ncbi:TetR family transcriptional regulator [Microbacterium mangrovi]|uniref:TetR family transcriptional regulator n=1 Tax=Microbacterium mangrovi TaxID=1348253 RepID=A0A0B2A7G3_9MICO|nr:TetR/AcrR family transcriptional regulator [Microbacterium mangrovi]KHK99444.1 TetR family transcriptional regulator [Microbacterium mangrovi]